MRSRRNRCIPCRGGRTVRAYAQTAAVTDDITLLACSGLLHGAETGRCAGPTGRMRLSAPSHVIASCARHGRRLQRQAALRDAQRQLPVAVTPDLAHVGVDRDGAACHDERILLCPKLVVCWWGVGLEGL